MGNPALIFDVINKENSYGNYTSLAVVLTEGVTPVRFDITMLGLADFFKLGELIGFTWIEV